MSGGRPSDYTPELGRKICDLISGAEAKPKSIRKIVRMDGMPAQSTIYRWLHEHNEFQENYARARELQADWYAEHAVEVAFSAKDAAIGRLKHDACKWAAGQLNGAKWGPRKIVEDGPERAKSRRDSAESVARILELAAAGGSGRAPDPHGTAPAEQGRDEFSVLRKGH